MDSEVFYTLLKGEIPLPDSQGDLRPTMPPCNINNSLFTLIRNAQPRSGASVYSIKKDKTGPPLKTLYRAAAGVLICFEANPGILGMTLICVQLIILKKEVISICTQSCSDAS